MFLLYMFGIRAESIVCVITAVRPQILLSTPRYTGVL